MVYDQIQIDQEFLVNIKNAESVCGFLFFGYIPDISWACTPSSVSYIVKMRGIKPGTLARWASTLTTRLPNIPYTGTGMKGTCSMFKTWFYSNSQVLFSRVLHEPKCSFQGLTPERIYWPSTCQGVWLKGLHAVGSNIKSSHTVSQSNYFP